MKNSLLILLLLVVNGVSGQIITTIAGGGTYGDGYAATASYIGFPNGIISDRNNNIYYCEPGNHTIRKIDSTGVISTIAGIRGSRGYNGDNIPATTAKLDQPSQLAFDKDGCLLVADLRNCRIRRINLTTGIITTICGNGASSSSGDGGAASAASLYQIFDIRTDKNGNIYALEINKIRRIDTNGIIYAVAGDNTLGETGDGGPATVAKVSPLSICVDDNNNLYIGSGMSVIRKIDSRGIITTVAGDTTSHVYNGDNIPATAAHFSPTSISYDNKRKWLLISDRVDKRLRYIDSSGTIRTLGGIGIDGNNGDGGRSDSAKMDPYHIAFDSCGNILMCQVNVPRIRKITFDTCLPDLPLGNISVNSSVAQAQPSVYPNPAYSTLHIEGNNLESYRLFNTLGVVVQAGALQNGRNDIDVAALPLGWYIVEIRSIDGYIRRQKVIVAR